MSYYSRLQKSFDNACRLPLRPQSKYVVFSDCHRGVGNANDNFLKNRTLYLAALKHYYRENFTYIELGDGDELWENRSLKQIMEIHSDVFEQLALFQSQERLYIIYGNHDLVKRKQSALLPGIQIHSGIILANTYPQEGPDIYLTHGHQADLLNSTFWRISRILVRYLWKPLEAFGVLDPTSAAKNHKRKEKTEQRLQAFARRNKHFIITGHTHRPYLSKDDPYYCNTGSCVHPDGVTCLEIECMQITLVKWTYSISPNMHLVVKRQVLAGPIPQNIFGMNRQAPND